MLLGRDATTLLSNMLQYRLLINSTSRAKKKRNKERKYHQLELQRNVLKPVRAVNIHSLV